MSAAGASLQTNGSGAAQISAMLLWYRGYHKCTAGTTGTPASMKPLLLPSSSLPFPPQAMQARGQAARGCRL